MAMNEQKLKEMARKILEIRLSLECNESIIDTVYLTNGELMGEALVDILLDLGMSSEDIDGELENAWRA